MEHFSKYEKDAMLQEEWEFDKNLIHQIYTDIVNKVKRL
jgi:hypothetical protein